MMEADELSAGRSWASASLRIASETMTPDAIGELLHLRASSTRSGEGDPAFSVWMLDSGLDPSAAVEDHLYILIERLSECHEALRTLTETAAVEVWLSLSPGPRHRSAVIDHRCLAAFADLGIDLVLDLYPQGKPAR